MRDAELRHHLPLLALKHPAAVSSTHLEVGHSSVNCQTLVGGSCAADNASSPGLKCLLGIACAKEDDHGAGAKEGLFLIEPLLGQLVAACVEITTR